MNGRQAKKLRREASRKAAEIVRSRAHVRQRWWLRPFLSTARTLHKLGIGLSDERVRRIARRGVVAEIL